MTHSYCHVWCLHQSVDSVVYCINTKCYISRYTYVIYLVISIPLMSTFSNDLTFNVECTMMTIIVIKLKKSLKGIFV